MRSFHSTACLLSMVAIVAGCSQTGSLRSSSPSDLKTSASVGDKPLPIVAGEPGASLRVEPEDIDRPAPSGARISGRVYDERGKPVPGVKVRLAVGGAAGGKAIAATTDRSGAFTLHGLRPALRTPSSRNTRTPRGRCPAGRRSRPRRPTSGSRFRIPAGPIAGTPRSGRHGPESNRSQMSTRQMKSPSTKRMAGPVAGSTPKTLSRLPRTQPPCCRRITRGPEEPHPTPGGQAGTPVRARPRQGRAPVPLLV